MSDEPTPEVRALAAKLFAAARAERPGPALGRRLQLIEPAQADRGAPSPRTGDASPARRAVAPAPSRVALWLAAAALIAMGVGLSLVLEPDPRPISISAERPPARAGSTSAEPLAEVAAPLAETEGARGASGNDVTPRSDDAPRVSPRRSTAPRPRARERHLSVDSATPQSVAPTAAAPTQPTPMTLVAELALLKRARTALRSGDGQQALALLTQRAREHTSNGLDAEATLLRIEALAALGRHGEASELATRFVRENPNNALGDRAKSFIRVSAPHP